MRCVDASSHESPQLPSDGCARGGAQLDAEALDALDFLVDRYFVKPTEPGVPPKNVLLQVIREVGEEMDL